jgi:hypothetical protein
MKRHTSILAGSFLVALLGAPLPARAQTAGLDPATKARVDRAVETIRQADALRKSIFLTYGSTPADRYVALQEFRDTRRRATLDAVEALLAVRGDFPKDQWKTLVEHFSANGPEPMIFEGVKTEIPSIMTDPARREKADKALKEMASVVERNSADRESARKELFRLLEKQSSKRDDFVSEFERFDKVQAKLDDRFSASVAALQQALTQAEWDELVQRISRLVPGNAP